MTTFTDSLDSLKFENETPLDNELGVLELLVRVYGGKHSRSSTIHASNPKPYIEITFFYEGCSGRDSQEYEYYALTPQVVQQLKQNHYVSGVPHWGYTSEREFKITKSGEEFYWAEKRRQEEEQRRKDEELRKQGGQAPAAT